MIKLIVSDVDGTLVPEGTNLLNPEYFDAIRNLKDEGIQFAVASGRHRVSVEKMFAPVKEDIFFITSNGAYIGKGGQMISKYVIPENCLGELFKTLGSLPDSAFLAETADDAWTYSTHREFIRDLTTGYNYPLKQVPSIEEFPKDILKVSLYCPGRILEMYEELNAKFKNNFKCVIAGAYWIDFIAPDVNKGQAVKKLQEQYHIHINETAAFGDQQNDAEMLKQAYFSHAVAGAATVAKNAARFSCGSCLRDGVLEILKRIVKGSDV